MAYKSMREFMAHLEREQKLVRVGAPVSTVLEMTEIQTRLLATGGPATLFEHPLMADGSRANMPVLTNLFGTVERVAMGVTMDDKDRRTAKDLREVGELLAFLRQPEPPRGLREALGFLPLAKTVMQMRPNTISGGLFGKSAPCQYRPWQTPHPNVLAGRTRSLNHVAAHCHQRPK
jgi:4-hydroxy-3-polyprenylbenzoate decarboxylase